jgi:pathogenesis-related protein 1
MLLMLAACGPTYQSPQAQPLPESQPMQGRPVAAARPSKPVTKSDAPKAAEPAKGDKMDAVAEQFIEAHNRVRAKHCAPPLTWSKKLADIAQKWANTLRDKGCVFGHSPGAKYGENLAAGTQGALDPTSTVDMWYDEIKLYKFPSGGFSMRTGHFTQLVWRSTQQVGCGHVTCKGNDVYVCNYDPPGNWEGQYKNQVLAASCKK